MEAVAQQFFGTPNLFWEFNVKSARLEERIHALSPLVLKRHKVPPEEQPEVTMQPVLPNNDNPEPRPAELNQDLLGEPSKRETPPEDQKPPEIEDQVPPQLEEEGDSSPSISEEVEETPGNIADVKTLNERYPKLFTGKLKIVEAEDTPPSETEYEPEVIAPRQVENIRKREPVVRYDDADFEEEEEGGAEKPKRKKKEPTLEKKVGIKEKDQVILVPIDPKEKWLVELLNIPPKKLEMFPESIIHRLKQFNNKFVIKGYPSKSVEDYNIGALEQSPVGRFLAAMMQLSLKNVIIRDSNLRLKATTNKRFDVNQWIYDMEYTLQSEIRKKLDDFRFYTKFTPPEGVEVEETLENSLRLVLDYVRMQVIQSTGFEEKTLYVVKFSQPRDPILKQPFEVYYHVKYQNMIQWRWLYYLYNPELLMESIMSGVWEKYRQTLENSPQITPQFVETTAATLKSGSQKFLSTFVDYSLNFASFFGVEYYEKLFQPYHILAERQPKTERLTVGKDSRL